MRFLSIAEKPQYTPSHQTRVLNSSVKSHKTWFLNITVKSHKIRVPNYITPNRKHRLTLHPQSQHESAPSRMLSVSPSHQAANSTSPSVKNTQAVPSSPPWPSRTVTGLVKESRCCHRVIVGCWPLLEISPFRQLFLSFRVISRHYRRRPPH